MERRGIGPRAHVLAGAAARPAGANSPPRYPISLYSLLMAKAKAHKLSVVTVSMLIIVTTFGLSNVIDNLVELGLSAIPSWIAVGFVYFLPMALILAEFASDTTEARGGIYSYMERGIGPTWAFIGTWSYFVSSLIYLQSSFSQLPIRASLAIAEVDVFETATALLPPSATSA